MSLPLPALLFLIASACVDRGEDPDEFSPSSSDPPGLSLDESLVDGVDHRTYAFLEVASGLMVDPGPFSNEIGTTVTTSTKLVDWSRERLEIQWTETLCGLEATAVFGSQTVFPPAFIDTFPVLERTGHLSEAVTGATFTAGPHPTVMGAHLEDPMDEALPSSADDPRVFDQDEDGEPGVTVQVDQALFGHAEVFLVQRDTNAFDGVVVSRDRIEGLTTTDTEQVILGASSWWAETPTESSPDPEPSHSWFILQEVDEAMDCATLLAQRDAIFE